MKKIFFLFVFLFGLVIASFGLDQVIYTTIPPLAGLVNSILGADIARSIVPEGIDPHHFSISVSRLEELLHAREIFALNGRLEIEAKIISPIEEWKEHPDIFFVGEDISLLDGDPHIWLSLRNLKIITLTIARHLSRDVSRQVERIEQLDERFKRLFSETHTKAFLCLHPAWRYFARDYGLEMISVMGNGHDVSPGQMARIISECREKGIKFIFVEQQFNQKLVMPIAGACKLKVMRVNPLSRDIIGEFERIADILEDMEREDE